jgi:PPOX class probable F420-dependent enzyme
MTGAEVGAFMLHGTRTAKVATRMRDGHPHVVPMRFVLDGPDVVFTTHSTSAKARHLRLDPRLALVVDEESPPYAFVHVRGRARISEDPDELLRFATRIGDRYMGAARALEFALRNGARGELLVRVIPERVIAKADVAGWGLTAPAARPRQSSGVV